MAKASIGKKPFIKAAKKAAKKPVKKVAKKARKEPAPSAVAKKGRQIAKTNRKAGEPLGTPYTKKEGSEWIGVATRSEPVRRVVLPPRRSERAASAVATPMAAERSASLAAEAMVTDAGHASIVPAMATALLRMAPEDGSQDQYGTAWMVGPRTLVTAAHNVCGSFGTRNWIGIALGHNDVGAPARYAKCCGYFVTPSWESDPTDGNPDDYAILIMAQPLTLPPSGRMFRVTSRTHHELEEAEVSVLGYRTVADSDYGVHWTDGSILPPVKIDTSFKYVGLNGAGMSGGPVYYEADGNYFVVGVHRGVISGLTWEARRIDATARDKIRGHVSNPICPS